MMRVSLRGMVGVLCAFCLLLSAGCREEAALDAPETVEIVAGSGVRIRAELARTPQQHLQGLMHRRSLPPDGGMLFVFQEDVPRMFWMKNTFISLDMVFLSADRRIRRIYHDVPASTSETSDAHIARRGGRARYILELPAGAAERHGLRPGQRLEFELQ